MKGAGNKKGENSSPGHVTYFNHATVEAMGKESLQFVTQDNG
jgi:hypothetical protein